MGDTERVPWATRNNWPDLEKFVPRKISYSPIKQKRFMSVSSVLLLRGMVVDHDH